MSVSRFAAAKVNLYLHVTGKRPDGYHLLDSLAVFADVGDVLAAEPGAALTLAVDGPQGAGLALETDNLVLRAARLLAPERGAALRLSKYLPVASGIGGGSADAAAALRLLAAFWGVTADLPALSLRLGADVPVCLASCPARMQGIGDILAPAPRLPDFGLLLVNPGVAVPTPAVFKARRGGFSAPPALPAAWAEVDEMVASLAACGNDLQEAAIGIAPVIGEVLNMLAGLPGAKLARMSGSGATCFALFATAAAAAAAVERMPQGWWAWGGGLYQPAPKRL